MEKKCNLELGLCSSSTSASIDSSFHFPRIPTYVIDQSRRSVNRRREQRQQMVVFCNGRNNLCDLTELQARAIIWFASQERNERPTWPNPEMSCLQLSMNWDPRFSIEKSLRRFLRGRKRRLQSLSPYHKL